MFITHYRCDVCGFEAVSATGHGSYRMADGTFYPTSLESVWCARCETITLAETLPKFIHAMRSRGLPIGEDEFDPGDEPADDETLGMRRESHGRLMRLLREMAQREAPSRCLTCGLFDHEAVGNGRVWEPESFPHPGCRGTFRQTNALHASVSGGGIRLDLEGIEIEEIAIEREAEDESEEEEK